MKHHLYEKTINEIIRTNWVMPSIIDEFYKFISKNSFSLKQQDELIRMLFILHRFQSRQLFNSTSWDGLLEITDQWYVAWTKILHENSIITYFGNNEDIKTLSSLLST